MYIDVYTHVHRAAVVLYPDVRAAVLQVWRRFGCILFLDLPSKETASVETACMEFRAA